MLTEAENTIMTGLAHPALVALPSVSFLELRAQLEDLGWTLESQGDKPIIPAEPELAVFVHRTASATIHYTFNPVVKFRVLQFRGPDARLQQALALRRISSLSATEIRALLGSREIREQLLGLFAAEELGEIAVLDVVERLCIHPDDKIARTAVRVRESLQSKTIAQAADLLLAEQKLHPERSALFSNLSGAELRKQVLRWLMRDLQASNAGIDQVLRSALVDVDPEVRITAVLAAAKLNAVNVASAVRDAEIPTSTRHGADERDRLFYKRLRQAAIEYLATASPSSSGTPGEIRRKQFRRAISGELEVRDDPTLLLHSLTTPLQARKSPISLPEGVQEDAGIYYLRRSRLALCWVPPIAHWLGEDSARFPLPSNPIRQVNPESGFFMAQLPLSSELALWTSDPGLKLPGAESQNAQPFLCGCDVAAHQCEVLSKLEGIQLELPSADQWEMAARGPDGRRYPWGNCLDAKGLDRSSPWSLRRMVGEVCEWTQEIDSSGARIVCGGQQTLVCARRSTVADHSQQCAVRPVLNWRVG
jgi:hypothetical protein